MKPDIPEQNLANQLISASCPVTLVLDSVLNIDFAIIGVVIRELASAVALLRQGCMPVDAKAVTTCVGYDRILQLF